MSRFKNFSMWRGRLPHWRADDVVYYVTFKHRRELDEKERQALFKRMMSLRDLELFCLAVFPDHTELMTHVVPSASGKKAKDLSDTIDKARRKVSNAVSKKTGETRGLFYTESYDRIVRDQAEYELFCEAILEALDAFEEGYGEIETVWFAESTPTEFPDGEPRTDSNDQSA